VVLASAPREFRELFPGRRRVLTRIQTSTIYGLAAVSLSHLAGLERVNSAARHRDPKAPVKVTSGAGLGQRLKSRCSTEFYAYPRIALRNFSYLTGAPHGGGRVPLLDLLGILSNRPHRLGSPTQGPLPARRKSRRLGRPGIRRAARPRAGGGRAPMLAVSQCSSEPCAYARASRAVPPRAGGNRGNRGKFGRAVDSHLSSAAHNAERGGGQLPRAERVSERHARLRAPPVCCDKGACDKQSGSPVAGGLGLRRGRRPATTTPRRFGPLGARQEEPPSVRAPPDSRSRTAPPVGSRLQIA
jgi:hypothetical protein